MEGLQDLEKSGLDTDLTEINGFWFMTKYASNIVRVVNEFKPLPDDVILASFPKTGTTWLKSLVFSIINRDNPRLESILVDHNPHDLVPFLEYQVLGSTTNESLSRIDCTGILDGDIRIFGTHIPYQLIGKVVDSCRVVYITRNPKDMLVSRWHFEKRVKLDARGPALQPDLEELVEKFCTGKIARGPYYEHVLGYKMASDEKPDKVFFITYEELVADTKTHVERLAEFLGCPFHEADKEKGGAVEEIVKSCSFDTLSSHQVNKSEDSTRWFPVPYASFFRRGVAGDHRNYLDDSKIERIDALTRAKFHAAGFIYGI